LLNFAQIAGVLGGFELNWPGEGVPHPSYAAHRFLARLASYRCGLAGKYYISTFLDICGILDFDIDVTGPQCIVEWTWISNFYLQLSLPLVVRDCFGPTAACTAVILRACGGDRRCYIVLPLALQVALVNLIEYVIFAPMVCIAAR
jgi:hypothetical protein